MRTWVRFPSPPPSFAKPFRLCGVTLCDFLMTFNFFPLKIFCILYISFIYSIIRSIIFLVYGFSGVKFVNTVYKNVIFILSFLMICEIQSASLKISLLESDFSQGSLSDQEVRDWVAQALGEALSKRKDQIDSGNSLGQKEQEQEREFRECMYNGLVPSEQICAQTKTVFLPAGEFKTIKYKAWKSDNLPDSAPGMLRNSEIYWAKGRIEVRESALVFRGYPIDVLNKAVASLKANGMDFKKIVLIFPFADEKTSKNKNFYADFYYIPLEDIIKIYPERHIEELKGKSLEYVVLPQSEFEKRSKLTSFLS